jgi:hypothetical protein
MLIPYKVVKRFATWRSRALRPSNRFDPATFCIGAQMRWYEKSFIGTRPVLKVFVAGNLKPPATNRGVSPRKDSDIVPCCRCGFPTEQAKLSIAFPHGAIVCPACYKIVMR